MLVRDIIRDVKDLLGKCDDERVFSRISESVVQLSNIGNFDLLTGYVDICACSDGCTITLPRQIETPLAVNIDGRPAFFRSKWFEFHLNGPGSMPRCDWTWDDRGFVPVVMDIIQPSYLLAIADLKTDLSAQLRVFGFDQNNDWIRTQNADGSWSDGFLVPINILSDFPMNIPTFDAQRRFVRDFRTPVNTELVLTGASEHQLTTGAPVILSLVNAPLPGGLINGTTYFARKVSDTRVSLHSTQSGALLNTGVIEITSWDAASIVSLTDRRQIVVQSKFTASSTHIQRTGMRVQFIATTFPSPLVALTDYFTRVIDATNFQIHASPSDAEDNLSPIDVTTPGVGVSVKAFQDADPITHLDFTVPHNFLQGDSVKVVNSSGQLPAPLLPEVTYFVRYISATRITLHATVSDAATGENPIVLLSSGAGASSVVKSVAAIANVGSSNNITSFGHNLTIQSTFAGKTTATRARATNVATLTFTNPHLLQTGDLVTISGVSGTGYNSTTPVAVTKVTTKSITYQNAGANEAPTADVGGTVTKLPQSGDFVQFATSGVMPAGLDQNTTYRAEPPMSSDTFTVYTTGAVPVNILNAGSGQLQLVISRVFTVGFTSDWRTNATVIINGTPVKLATDGALPSASPALNNSTTYFARKINDATIQLFDTSGHSTDTAIRTTTLRSRAANVATLTTSAAHTFSNGDKVDISGVQVVRNGVLTTINITSGGTLYVEGETATITDAGGHTATGELSVAAGVITNITILNGGSGFTALGALTITGSGSVDAVCTVATVTNNVATPDSTYNATAVTIAVTGATTFTYASVGLNEPSTADTGGSIIRSDIKIIGPASGQTELVFERTVVAAPFDSLLRISSSSFLEEGATIQLETDGTLPAPLATATDYHLSIEGGLLRIKDTLDNNITITTVGSGNHFMTIVRDFNVNTPTDFTVTDNNYDDGDAITLETTGTLPTGLSLATTYYVRRIDDNTVEFYDTEAHALAAPATTGRIVASNTGTGSHSIVQMVANFLVQKVERVLKSPTDGFVNLYAWDTGRTDALTLLGRYEPTETQPLYRRIKVPTRCSWVRMRYRKSIFEITSLDDFIPVRNKMAILMQIKGLDLLRKEFNDAAKAYLDISKQFILDQQSGDDGPSVPTLQINKDIFTDPDAQWMDSFYGRTWGP